MKIEIQDLYDGFNIKVDDKTFNFDQEDTREKMAEVLGVTEQIPDSYANDVPDLYDVVTGFQSLNPDDIEKFRSMICVPEQ